MNAKAIISTWQQEFSPSAKRKKCKIFSGDSITLSSTVAQVWGWGKYGQSGVKPLITSHTTTQGKDMPAFFWACWQSSIYSRTRLSHQICPFPLDKLCFIFYPSSFCLTENISQHGNRLFVYFFLFQKQSHSLDIVSRTRSI